MSTETATTLDLATGTAITRLVVPITTDHRFDRGVAVAAKLAEQWTVPIHLVSVEPGSGDAVSVAGGQQLEQARKALIAAHPAIEATDEEVAADDPVAAVAAQLAPSDLVIMATEHAGDEGGEPSFAEQLAHDWGGPIMMVGPEVDLDHVGGDVMTTVDGSALAERSLATAEAFAGSLAVSLWVVQIVPSAVTEQVARLREMGERVSESAYIRDTVERIGGRTLWEVVHSDEIVDAIVRFAAEHDIASLVMATHGASGLTRRVFGSVCMAVVHRSSRPVVVVRPADVAEPEPAIT